MLDEIAYQNMIQRRNRAKKLYNILKELYPKEYECRESLAILHRDIEKEVYIMYIALRIICLIIRGIHEAWSDAHYVRKNKTPMLY